MQSVHNYFSAFIMRAKAFNSKDNLILLFTKLFFLRPPLPRPGPFAERVKGGPRLSVCLHVFCSSGHKIEGGEFMRHGRKQAHVTTYLAKDYLHDARRRTDDGTAELELGLTLSGIR
jgi:hypothetical protein